LTEPHCKFNMRLRETRRRFGRSGEEQISSPAGFRSPDRPARSLVTTPTPLLRAHSM